MLEQGLIIIAGLARDLQTRDSDIRLKFQMTEPPFNGDRVSQT